jgi:FlgD Ig-like domain
MSTIIESTDMIRQAAETTAYFDNQTRKTTLPGPDGTELRLVVGNSAIDVRLSNSVPISALRFEITFEKRLNYKAPDISTRVQTFNNYVNFQDNVVTFVLLDMDGKGIPPGSGSIVSIPLDGEQRFDVTGAFASTRTTGISEIPYTVLSESVETESLILEQNDPNPFSGRTRLDFWIPGAADTKLVIYDVGGALIRTLIDSRLETGPHSIEWDGRDDSGKAVDSGIYLYKLYAGVYSVTKKMVFLSDGAIGK